MNNARRAAITKIGDKIDELKAELESLRDAEQDYYDNMPESFQCGDKGQRAEEVVGYLDEAISQLEEAIAHLQDAAE